MPIEGFEELKKLFPEATILGAFREETIVGIPGHSLLRLAMGIQIDFSPSPDNCDPKFIRREILKALLQFRNNINDKIRELGVSP